MRKSLSGQAAETRPCRGNQLLDAVSLDLTGLSSVVPSGMAEEEEVGYGGSETDCE